MKIKEIGNLCKKSKCIMLFQKGKDQWISDGGAVYPLWGLPQMDRDNIFAMFDIGDDKADSFYFAESIIPERISFEDSYPNEKQVEQCDISICVKGKILKPIITSFGVVYINQNHFKPFSDVEDWECSLNERITPDKHISIAVKKGLLLIGIIEPVEITEEILFEIKRLISGSSVTNKNMEQEELSDE